MAGATQGVEITDSDRARIAHIRSVWESNDELFRDARKTMRTAPVSSKEFAEAKKLGKKFFRLDHAYDVKGISLAILWLDMVLERHQNPVQSSEEQDFLRAICKGLSGIFEHCDVFKKPDDVEKIISLYDQLSPRYVQWNLEPPTRPFPDIQVAEIEAASSSEAPEPAGLPRGTAFPSTPARGAANPVSPTEDELLRPPEVATQSPLAMRDLFGPDPVETSSFISLSGTNSLTSWNPAMPFAAPRNDEPKEEVLSEPGPIPVPEPQARPTRVMEMFRARRSNIVPSPVVQSPVPDISDLSDLFGEDPPMDPTQPGESDQDVSDQLLVDRTEPGQTVEEMVNEWTVFPPEPAMPDEVNKVVHEAVQGLKPFFKNKPAVDVDAEADANLAAQYAPEMIRVATEALAIMRDKYDFDELRRRITPRPSVPPSQGVEPTPELEPNPEETTEGPIADSHQVLEADVDLDIDAAMDEPVPVPGTVPQETAEVEEQAMIPEEMQTASTASEGVSTSLPRELQDGAAASQTREGSQVMEVDVLARPAVPEPPKYSEQATQTDVPDPQETRTATKRPTGPTEESIIASTVIEEDCGKTKFKLEIAPEALDEFKEDPTAKFWLLSSYDHTFGPRKPRSSWAVLKFNFSMETNSEFLLEVDRSPVTPKTHKERVSREIIEQVNELEMIGTHCTGGLQGIRLDLKVVRTLRPPKTLKRDREAAADDIDGGQSDDRGLINSFKKARI